MPKIHGYMRVSTNDQHESGLGLLAQERTLKAYIAYLCARHEDMEEGRIYCEPTGVSASKVPFMKRPIGRELVKDIEVGDHVAFAKHNRAFRNVRDLVTTKPVFDERDIVMHFCDLGVDMSTKEGKLILTVMVSVAEWEAKAISERTKEALHELRVRGKRSNNLAPNGYYFDNNSNLVKDKYIHAVARYSNYLRNVKGMEFSDIGDRLEEIIAKRKGIKPRPRNGWNHRKRDFDRFRLHDLVACWVPESRSFITRNEARKRKGGGKKKAG